MKNYEIYGQGKDKWSLPKKIVELSAPSQGEAERLGANFANVMNVDFVSARRKGIIKCAYQKKLA